MNMFKLTAVAAALFLAAFNPAAAQWQAPNHSVPVGQGAGVTGFKSAAPGATGLPLTSNGATSDPSFQAIGNAAFGTTVPANTYKCNPTSSPGALQDCTNSSASVPGTYFVLCTGSGDSTALNAALAAAEAISPAGGTLKISGKCSISSPLAPTSGVAIRGDAMNQTFLQPTTSSISCINNNPTSASSVDISDITCSYATLSSSGAIGIQYGNATINSIGGKIERVNCTNCTTGIFCENCINVEINAPNIGPFYNYGIEVSSPVSPDSGGVIIHDGYIQNFSPATNSSIGIYWLSGGAFDVHDMQIFDATGIYIHQSLQTSELNLHHNLFSGTGTPTAAVQVDALNANYACTVSGTALSTSGGSGTIAIGQTATCNGTNLGQIVSGSGLSWVTTNSASTSGTGSSTFQMTELHIDDNIFDSTTRSVYIPNTIGGEYFLFNLTMNGNLTSSTNNSGLNQFTVYNTQGIAMNGNVIKCNGTCTGGRPIFFDSSTDHVGIFQPRSMEPGSWGATDIISSTNTCGMSTNALLTGC